MTTAKNSPAKPVKAATNSKAAPKPRNSRQQANTASQAPKTAAKAPAKPTGPRIKVDHDAAKKAKYRGAREAWLEALVEWDGQTLANFKDHVQSAPPSTPKTGKWAGKCEPPMGWVRFFIREQIVKLVD